MSHNTVAPDGFAMEINAYQGSIYLTRKAPLEKNPNVKHVLTQVCVSPILMKCLAIKLKKFLRDHEDKEGPIHISQELANKEGFSLAEDWA